VRAGALSLLCVSTAMSFSSDSPGSVSDVLSLTSSSDSPPPSPSKRRRRPTPLRLTHVGIDPGDLVGKVLTRIRRSPNHPTLTLDFSDNTTFQVLVDGYDPVHQGTPKELEMNPSLDPLFNPPNGQLQVSLTVVDCALVTLTDKAFLKKTREAHWDQNHLGLGFKFAGAQSWHCVWATMIEYDEQMGGCVFRSYDDVYLDTLQRSPRKRRRLSWGSNASKSPTKASRTHLD
jgi:hypothetical protein